MCKKILLTLSTLLIHAHVSFASQAPVDYAKEIQPLFNGHCTACHNAAQAKGGLRLETYADLLKGGKSGAVLTKGNGAQSLMYLQASGKEDPVMPPKKNKANATALVENELQTLKRWIDEGAKNSTATPVAVSKPMHWHSMPLSLKPIEAVAISGDAQYAACSRANQVFLYQLPANVLAAQLADPALGINAADRDMVLSLAFSPDGETLAAGGYRSIKIWRHYPLAPVLTLETEMANATVCSASPDGKWLATAGAQNRIRIWDAATGKMAREWSGRTAVKSVQFSPDSKRICSAHNDKLLRIWTLAGVEQGHAESGAEVAAIAWLADNERVAAGGADNLIRVWAFPESGEWAAPKELTGHGGAVTALSAVTPNKILSGSADGSVRLWDADSGKEILKMDHGAPVSAVAVQSDGKRFASAGGNFAKSWKADGKSSITAKGDRHAYEAQSEAERTAAFQKDQIAFYKTQVQENEKNAAAETENVKKALEKVKSAAAELIPKQEAAKKAADARQELEKSLVEPRAQLLKATEAKDAAEKAAAAVSQESKTAADKLNQSKAQAAKATDAKNAADKTLADLTAKPEKPDLTAGKAQADAAKTALDAAIAAQTAAEKTANDAAAKSKSTDEAKNSALKAFTDLTNQLKDADGKLKAADKALVDANRVLSDTLLSKNASDQNHERLENVKKKADETLAAAKAALANLEAGQKQVDAAVEAAKKAATDAEKAIRAVAFSPDSRVLATAGESRSIRTWNPENGRAGEEYSEGKDEPVNGLAFLPDGRLLSVGAGTKALVWAKSSEWKFERAIGTGDEKSPLVGRVLALAFSPDGKLLASGGGIPAQAGELKLWNPADGALVREIPDAHSDTIFGVAFTRDGQMLASGAADKNVKVFDPSSGRLIKLFEGHTNHVLSVAWKRNGRMLASGGADKVAKLWDMITGEQTRSIDGFKKEVTSVSFLEGASEVLVASGDTSVQVAREEGKKEGGNEGANKIRSFKAGTEYVQAAAVTPDGKTFCTGGADSTLRIFLSNKDQALQSFDAPKAEPAPGQSVRPAQPIKAENK